MKPFLVQTSDVDHVSETVLKRVQGLLESRQDVKRVDLAVAIRRESPSWLSEFLAGKRQTNDLRLVIRMARFFGVPVGYLLNEVEPEHDGQTTALLAAWHRLTDQRDRDAVLGIALTLARRDVDTDTVVLPGPRPAADEGGRSTADRPAPTPPKKRREK
jgi:transcriptional regulator with XRE-family HTH domain